MDGERFDALARGLSGASRRAVVRGLGGGLVALAAGVGLGLEAADAKSCHKKCKNKTGAAKRRCKQKCQGGGLCRDLGQSCGPDVGACCGARCAGQGATRVCLDTNQTNGGLSVTQLTDLLGTLGLADLADILGHKLDLSVLDLGVLADAINALTPGQLAHLLNSGILGVDLFESVLDLVDTGLLTSLINGGLLDTDILDALLNGGVLCGLLPLLPIC